MSYLVLARKYRPRRFAEVAGQETATRTLQGAIQEHRIGHAYLFHGPRGTGKTTSARIFAKALICERGPALEPCLECDQCRDVDNGSHVDVIEMDAASNRGIEHARELRERVGYAPMRARFKVYIIDEVHQLTKEAFNALLKTLEEPPAHVKFLFATTEPNKVIETVRSRCQLVQLALIKPDVISARLTEIFGRESISAAPGVTDELAKLARGSLRDGLSIADQLIALVGNQPAREDVRRVAPAGGPEEIEALLERVERGDKAAVLTALPAGEGQEPELLGALLDHLRTALLCRLRPNEAQLFESDAVLRQRFVALADRLGGDRLELWLEELLLARERCERLPRHARVITELALLELCRKETTQSLATLAERLLALEQRSGVAAPARTPLAPSPADAATLTPAAPRAARPPPQEVPVSPRANPPAAVAASPARASAPPPKLADAGGSNDSFTRAVADVFQGHIEENER